MLRCYPKVDVEKQSFLHVKVVTVPKQSMSLREIIKRFVRNESLPVQKEGIYEENMGDLEKFAKEDLTVKHERAEQAARNVRSIKERLKKGKPVESPSVGAPPKGDVTGSPVVGQAPPAAQPPG